MLAAVVGLQLGAFGVVLETTASGISDLPFGSFVLLMQPIHLAIGVVEGLATAAVVAFVARARPEALAPLSGPAARSLRPVLAGLLLAAILLGAVVSWFASSQLDGLEWSIKKTTGHEELQGSDDGIHAGLAKIQEKTAFLPDYGFKPSGEPAEKVEPWPAVNAGTSVSGIIGGLITLAVVALIGYTLKARRTAQKKTL
jgi:cobalt/nickel transport system permease protein